MSILVQTLTHGIMGRRIPDNFLFFQPRLDLYYLPVVEGLIFCISATPHLGTSFPLFHALTADFCRMLDVGINLYYAT